MKNSISPQKQFSVHISHAKENIISSTGVHVHFHYTILWILHYHTQNGIIPYINSVSGIILAQNNSGENIPFSQK